MNGCQGDSAGQLGHREITVNTGKSSRSQTIWLTQRKMLVFVTAGDPMSELCIYCPTLVVAA